MYVCMYACMHACMYVCTYVCMYVCSHFLWLDVGRCPHLLAPPLNLDFLRAARGRFAIFAAWDKLTPCFGGLSRQVLYGCCCI